MEELKILYKELQERQEHLESRKKTKTTEGRIAENLLTMVRVQQLLIPLVVQQSEQLVCGDCDNYAEYDGGIKYCSVCGTKLS
jgi:NADH pyrophosphatase NudC (nudix superfamily)